MVTVEQLEEFYIELKSFAGRVEIPIVTADEELNILFYNDENENNRYESVGKSNKLIFDIYNTICVNKGE